MPAPRPRRSAAGLEPYVPDADRPWNTRRAAHLLRRTGFGAPAAAVQETLLQSPADAVDAIVDAAVQAPLPEPPPWHNVPPPPRDAPEAERDAYNSANGDNRAHYQAAWLEEMRTGGLRERMALFWHNHFVTGYRSYSLAPYQYQYLTTLRTYALGNFKAFTHAVGTLPAMLYYLNGNRNRRGAPNENYARELLELFTMGLKDDAGNDNYSQQDIAEIARALTGWVVERDTLSSYLDDRRFDEDEKSFLGQTGAFGYNDVIDIIFAQRQTSISRFIARKLYRHFVYDTPDEAVVAELGDLLVAMGFEIAPVLRTLLKSAHFFDDVFIGARIKSPVELMVGLFNETGIVPNEEALYRLRRYVSDQGQQLFEPPNVAGWPGHHSWISTLTMPLRWYHSGSAMNGLGDTDPVDLVPVAQHMAEPDDPYVLAPQLVDYFLAVPVPEEEENEYVNLMLGGVPDYEWVLDQEVATPRLREFAEYLFQRPEYQLM